MNDRPNKDVTYAMQTQLMPIPFCKSLDDWMALIRDRTRNLTDIQAAQAAGICYAAVIVGRPTCVWHAASIVTNTLDKCCCVPCSEARKEAAA